MLAGMLPAANDIESVQTRLLCLTTHPLYHPPRPVLLRNRLLISFPNIEEPALAALTPETKMPPGRQAEGTVVVRFPVTQDGFDKRKSLSVAIQPYDQPLPLVLTK